MMAQIRFRTLRTQTRQVKPIRQRALTCCQSLPYLSMLLSNWNPPTTAMLPLASKNGKLWWLPTLVIGPCRFQNSINSNTSNDLTRPFSKKKTFPTLKRKKRKKGEEKAKKRWIYQRSAGFESRPPHIRLFCFTFQGKEDVKSSWITQLSWFLNLHKQRETVVTLSRHVPEDDTIGGSVGDIPWSHDDSCLSDIPSQEDERERNTSNEDPLTNIEWDFRGGW